MEEENNKIQTLQETLNLLSLQLNREQKDIFAERVFLGKIMSTLVFKRYIVSEIVAKTWRLKNKVNIEKVGENTFKFNFGSKEDRDGIFRARLWSLNGAHLVLKEWLESMSLQQISFSHTTFII